MMKAKKYDWKDSNLALFGSDTEKQVKKESAESEPAWQGAGQTVSTQVWRVNKFKIESWPQEDFGQFFSGDSYIILNTYKKEGEDELEYDLHFWIGKYSTQDEYGTAAYKTVELDTFLDDKPVQHREVQGHESSMFKSYFPAMTILKGGCDTGFTRVLPEQYTPRLFIVKKESRRNITFKQISPKRCNYSEDDVFILDTGRVIYQINGENCSHDEKFSAAQHVVKLCDGRGNVEKQNIDGDPFSDPTVAAYFSDKEKKEKESDPEWPGNNLFVVSDADGCINMETVVENGGVDMNMLSSDSVSIVDLKDACYVWLGTGSSVDERKNGLTYACNYLSKTQYPWKRVSVIQQGKEPTEFTKLVA